MVDLKLEYYRQKAKLSTRQLALLLGVSENVYREMESGKTDIGIGKLQTLCDFYSLSIEDFLKTETKTSSPKIEAANPDGSIGKKPHSKIKKCAKTEDLNDPHKDLREKYGVGIEESKTLNLFAQIIADIVLEEDEMVSALEQSPGGFHPEGKRKACLLCGTIASGKGLWYDENGYQCSCCKAAIDIALIPKSVLQEPGSYYTDNELDHFFNLRGGVLQGWIKAGLLKPTIIPGDKPKEKHFRIYLLSKHIGFLPPKEMLELASAENLQENGQDYIRFETRWYNLVDPVTYLKDFKIIELLRFD